MLNGPSDSPVNSPTTFQLVVEPSIRLADVAAIAIAAF
jgi:hypothetical protein